MSKSDKSIHNICIASIKRSIIKPYDFKWTMFYMSNDEFQHFHLPLSLLENELIICSTIIDNDNYSILTTRQLISKIEGVLKSEDIHVATAKMYGDFKGYKDNTITIGQVELLQGQQMNYLIEVGRASMVFIKGIRTLIRTVQIS